MKLGPREKVEGVFLLTNGESLNAEWNGRTVALHRLKLAKRGGQGNRMLLGDVADHGQHKRRERVPQAR